MTDPILGGYTRHETPTAADDFARAEFARHPDGGVAAKTDSGDDEPWNTTDGSWWSDAEMAANGWSPVRECPYPEQHSNGLPDAVRALTKAVNDLHERAEKAEQERDEALTERDAWEERITSLVYSLATVEEVGEWSSGSELDQALIDHMQGKIQRLERSAAESRPLTPDAITDAQRQRGYDTLRAFVAAGNHVGSSEVARRGAVMEIIKAVLTEPPARPDGAEEIEFLIADRLGGDVPGDVIRALAEEIAERAGATRLYPQERS